MKRTLMTDKEMDKRLKKLPKNMQKAQAFLIKLEIEKWVRLGFKENWNWVVKHFFSRFAPDVTGRNVSSLCLTRGFGSCKKHQLFNNGCVLKECTSAGHPFLSAITAIRSASTTEDMTANNRRNFMQARRNIIRRLRRALEKVERGEIL